MDLERYWSRVRILANPWVLYRITRGMFRALVLRKNTLRVMYLMATFACQARCTMCSVAKFRRSGTDSLTPADYESIADQGARMGAIAVTILGGEPLLMDELEEVVRVFASRHYFVSVVTNGFGLDERRARSLKEAGLGSVHFGLESLSEEENDALRGPGQCRAVKEAIVVCRDAGLRVGICTVFTPGATERAVELADYCKEHGLMINLPTRAAVGAAEGAEHATADDYEELLRVLKEHPRAAVDWGFSYFLRPRCPAGKEKIAITCYGDVLGCSLNHISFGNVRDEPLETIWKRVGKFSAFSRQTDRCLAAFDDEHVRRYLDPIAQFDESPVHYTDHPAIAPEDEPDLFQS